MNSIVLVPIGRVDGVLLDALKGPIESAFNANTSVQHEVVDSSPFYYPERKQFNSTDILHYLSYGRSENEKKGNSARFLGITGEDLFIPILTYVFGEAELNGSSAVISYYRLLPERYGLEPDPDLVRERVVKEGLHELGHSFGLVHCFSPNCVMHSSTYVEEIDLKPAAFCKGCNASLSRWL